MIWAHERIHLLYLSLSHPHDLHLPKEEVEALLVLDSRQLHRLWRGLGREGWERQRGKVGG